MKSFKLFTLITSSLICAGVTFGATWVTVTDSNENPPEVTLLNNDADSVVFKVTIPGFYKEDESEGGTTYQRIWFEGEMALSDSGFPALPAIIRNTAIPNCDSISVQVYKYGSTIFNNYLVYPAPNTNCGLEPVFCKNDSIYETNEYYPEKVEDFTGIQEFRDQRLIELALRPISFSPDSNKIQVYDSLRVKITFINANGSVNEDVGIYCSAAKKMFLNYELDSATQTWDPGYQWCTPENISNYSCDYLIITAGFVEDSLSCKSKIEELAQHRANYNNFAVCLVNVEDIYNWTRWDSVQGFIRNVYLDGSSAISSDGHLPFVLLVGDAWDDDGYGGGDENDPLIPRTERYTSGNNLGSDHYYAACIGEDDIEDVALGRLPIGNNTTRENTYPELDFMVDKIISYETEQLYYMYEDWKKAIMLQAGWDGYPNYQEPEFDRLVDIFSDTHYTYFCKTYSDATVNADDVADFSSWTNATSSDTTKIRYDWVIKMLNGTYDAETAPDPKGALTYFYLGHGSVNDRLAWWVLDPDGPYRDLEWTPDDPYPPCNEEGVHDSVTNHKRLPLFVLCSCNQGHFDVNVESYTAPYTGPTYSVPGHNEIFDCFAEQYTVKDSLGAIGVIAAAKSTSAWTYPLAANYAEFLVGDELPEWHELIGWSLMVAKNIPCYISIKRHYMLFGDPALNLFVEPTYTGTMTQNTTWSGRVDLVGDLTVASGISLTVQAGTEVVFHNDAKLKILGTIIANTVTDPILFRSGISQGNGIQIVSGASTNCTIRNCELESLKYGVRLDSCQAFNNSIKGNTFTECDYGIYAYRTSTDIDSNKFVACSDAALKLIVYSGDVTRNTIEMADESYGIWAESSTSAEISENSIYNASDQEGDIGMYFYNCTGAVVDTNNVTGAGYSEIDFVHCVPVLTENILHDGPNKGVRLYSGSQPVMNYGDGGYNRIADHDSAEIWIEGYKFPWLRNGHNDICDADDPSTPSGEGEYLIEAYFDSGDLPQGGYVVSVTDNWWYAGSELTDTNSVHDHILPDNDDRFKVWVKSVDDESNTGYSTSGIDEPTLEDIFLDAVALQMNGNYQDAYDEFAAIIADYTENPVAVAAGHHLFSCGIALEMSMSVLDAYFTNLAQNASADFERDWENLASYCQVENGEYGDAINYYESIITDPTSALADSVYAVIDAGAAYLRASLAGGCGTLSSDPPSFGTMAQLCPASHREYEIKVKQLLNMLSGDLEDSGVKSFLPAEFALHQNFPNPFNPTTAIRYDLPEIANVTLKVYNVMGQLVATLVDQKESAGYKRLDWNGQNKYGRELSSGMYILHLVTKGESGKKYTKAKKMLLIK